MKNSVRGFLQAKQNGEKLAVLTAYDYSLAMLMDEAGVNGILVGDTLGMVVLGHKTTLPVTMEDMIRHSGAVARGVASSLLIADMPFLSYKTSIRDAVCNAGRLVQEGNAQAVKLEGGEEVCPQIRAIVRASIPVMGHIGLMPQSINALGGFFVQGKDEEGARGLLRAAKAVEEAGAFAVVLECVPAGLAALISRSLSIPTIGIGAGGDCDGQVLVCHDMLGMFADFTPKFVKRFADLGPQIRTAFADYVAEVRQGAFPGPEHSYAMDDAVLDKI